jgi:hypothetical protein
LPRIVRVTVTGGSGRAPVGAVRHLRLDDGSSAEERLVACDDDRMAMSYTFEYDHPFPVRSYLATVEVRPVTTTGASFVSWTGRFDADTADEERARASFERIYTAFLAALADHLATDHRAADHRAVLTTDPKEGDPCLL